MLSFDTFIFDHSYSRPYLAKLWGYKSHHAISRGVVMPSGLNVIVLFVTKEKQKSLTQYEDHIEADMLFWEGEKGHGSDRRIIAMQDEIHVFYRDKHHSDFLYKGKAQLNSFKLLIDRPSKFIFSLIDSLANEQTIVADIQEDYTISNTDREAIVLSRNGQGPYRSKSIGLWKTCSVTGFTNPRVLIASHIKPWKISSNIERVNPFNSLLLVPTLDKLFDRGFIGFENTGEIILSNRIGQRDWDRIGVSRALNLRQVPEQTKHFLDYHREYIFDLKESIS
jgi:putative restriction endonuclease